MKITSKTYYPEDSSTIKDIGRYTAATVEYSSLVMLSVLERGGRSFGGGIDTAVNPCKKAVESIGRASKPLMGFAKKFKKIATPLTVPFTWTAKQVAETGGRGLPFHLDKKSMTSLQNSLKRIEERLENIERKGISVAGGVAAAPTANDFKKKTSKKKNMLLRAILEDSKHTLED